MAKKKDLDPAVEARKFVDAQLQALPAEDPRRPQLLVIQEAIKDDAVAAVLGEGVVTRNSAGRVVQQARDYQAQLEGQAAQILAARKDLEAQQGKILAYDTLVNTGALARLKQAAGSSDPDDLDGDLDSSGGRSAPAPSMSQDEIRQLVAAQVQQVVGPAAAQYTQLLAYTTGLAGQHMKEFGEALDVPALFAHCQRVGMPMDKGGYDSFVGESRQEQAEVAQKEHDKKIAQEARESAVKDFAAKHGLPYLVGQDSGGAAVRSPLGLGPGGLPIPEPPSVIEQVRERARVRAAEAAGKDPKSEGGMDSAAAAVQLYTGLMSRPTAGGVGTGR